MELMTTCRRCREPFTPSHQDYVIGPHRWQICPGCRERDTRHDATRPPPGDVLPPNVRRIDPIPNEPDDAA